MKLEGAETAPSSRQAALTSSTLPSCAARTNLTYVWPSEDVSSRVTWHEALMLAGVIAPASVQLSTRIYEGLVWDFSSSFGCTDDLSMTHGSHSGERRARQRLMTFMMTGSRPNATYERAQRHGESAVRASAARRTPSSCAACAARREGGVSQFTPAEDARRS